MKQNIVIFLGGEQGSGKSTSAEFLTEYLTNCGCFMPMRSFKFAGLLYDLQATAEGGPVSKKNGPFLQDVGDAIRKNYGEDYLVARTKKSILEFFEQSSEKTLGPAMDGPRAVIVDDVRMATEIALEDDLSDLGYLVISIYLDCPEDVRKVRSGDLWRPNTSHKTESELSEIKDMFDYQVSTSGFMSDRNSLLADILIGKGIRWDSKADLDGLVAGFNTLLRRWEENFGSRANFSWNYDKDGRKALSVREVEKFTQPTHEQLTAKAEFTADVLSNLEPATVKVAPALPKSEAPQVTA